MRHINGVYTQRHNRMKKTDGSVFRGRYKAILVDADNYLLQLSRYIHLNPVSAFIVEKPEEYRWSSYTDYINPQNKPIWLHCEETLAYFESVNPTQNYQEFVMQG